VAGWVFPEGNWVFIPYAFITGSSPDAANTAGSAQCQLRDPADKNIGAAYSAIANIDNLSFIGILNLTWNGGAVIPAGGGEVSLWCGGSNLAHIDLRFAQVLAIQVGGFQ
jgi:hypothetical protein